MQGFWSALRHVCIRYLMIGVGDTDYRQIVLEAAAETKILSRTFTPWSHLLALIYQQLTRTESPNGVCDAAAAQRRGAARILRREWDSTWWNPRGGGLQTPVFAGFPAVRRRANGTARVEKPAFSGLSGIAMKNGGVYRSSAYSRTQVATRIFEHYELAPMRSGMVVFQDTSGFGPYS